MSPSAYLEIHLKLENDIRVFFIIFIPRNMKFHGGEIGLQEMGSCGQGINGMTVQYLLRAEHDLQYMYFMIFKNRLNELIPKYPLLIHIYFLYIIDLSCRKSLFSYSRFS